jgi:hypothetical protein
MFVTVVLIPIIHEHRYLLCISITAILEVIIAVKTRTVVLWLTPYEHDDNTFLRSIPDHTAVS